MDNTVIGSGAQILGPITVGKNSVIGGGLRVVSDVPENTLMKNYENIIVGKK